MKVNVKARPARDRPARAQGALSGNSLIWLTDSDNGESLKCAGYTSLADSPEVITAVNTIAGLIGSMTIHLMRNTDQGDVRVLNELARIVDIEPNRYMTRSSLIQWIVRTLYLEGRGNAVVFPRTERGRLKELIPIPAAYVCYTPEGLWDYKIAISGREYDPSSLLHFTLNPGSYYPWLGSGFTVALSDVANSLKQAAATSKGFMSSKWKPSLIVKVDGLDEAFRGKAGRRKLLDEYVEGSEAGEPWMIPAEQFDVQQVKPLTLSDLALADFVKLDKQTVAAILGVPAFVLGVGEFHRDQWNTFISTYIMGKAQSIQQVLTLGLVSDPAEFFRFSSRSLYNYDLKDLAKIAEDLYVRGAMTGNEVRDWVGLDPKDGLDELIILENFIPRGMIAEQNKLSGGGT